MHNLMTDMHDQYNARHLDAKQVAKYFVKSEHFDLLAKSRNSVLAGPRGSGKTTLLRMLCQDTLEQWPDNKGGEFRNKIGFTGVFIYTDVSWSELFNAIEQTMLSPTISKAIIGSIITSRIMASFVDTIHAKSSSTPIDTPHRRTEISVNQEMAIVRDISEYWMLKPEIASFRGLKVAVNKRLLDIGRLRIKQIRGGQINEKDLPDFIDLDYSQAVSSAIDSFNYHTESDEKWALLFDEMEFAPSWFLDKLFLQIRANDPQFFIKLAVSPLGRTSFLNEGLSPQVGNDYDSIRLWYTQSLESKSFCSKLWDSLIERRNIPFINPTAILSDGQYSHGELYTEKHNKQKARNSLTLDKKKVRKILKEYAELDDTFTKYLTRRNKTIDQISDATTESERGANLRKILPIVLFRSHYFKAQHRYSPSKPQQTKRSRKVPSEIYSGWGMMAELSEGNPRWFLVIATALLDQAYSGSGQSQTIYNKLTPRQQSSVFEKAGDAICAMYKVHPSNYIEEFNREIGILDLVQEIGGQFSKRQLQSAFTIDVVGSFSVDEHLSDNFYALIEDALISGAIVYLPNTNDSEIGFGRIMGKRFRLNYLLAPKYDFLPRLGKAMGIVPLIRGLNIGKNKVSQREIEFPRNEE